MFAALQLLFIVVSLTALVLAACLVLLPVRRERSIPVWCQPRQSRTTVKIVERRQYGRVICSVLECPLRSAGEPCSEICIRPNTQVNALLEEARKEMLRRGES